MATTNIPPQDIILEILLRLPVKSILRFRTISKSWLRSISNPSFALSYQNRARSTRNYILNGEGYLCKFSLDDTRRLEDLYFPCDPMVRVVGVCNGIVCLGLASLVILWNPATRKYRDAHCPEVYAHLPNVAGTEGRVCISRHSYGYGMDLSRREYVYLWIYCRRWDSTLHSVVRVYSAREDSWKVLEGDFRFQLTEYKNCAVVRGVPYWTAIVRKVEEEDKLSEVLVAFDVRNEVFKVVEYPEAAFKRGNRAYFVEFNEHLASLVYCPGEQGSQLVDVWVLDDGECWSKKFTVGPILMEIERLVGCSGDGDIMGLDTEHGLFLFLSRNKEIDYIYTNDGNYGDIDVHNYYETLVSVDGMKFIDKEE